MTILQLISAPVNTRAAFEFQGKPTLLVPVICFALVEFKEKSEETGDRQLLPMLPVKGNGEGQTGFPEEYEDLIGGRYAGLQVWDALEQQ